MRAQDLKDVFDGPPFVQSQAVPSPDAVHCPFSPHPAFTACLTTKVAFSRPNEVTVNTHLVFPSPYTAEFTVWCLPVSGADPCTEFSTSKIKVKFKYLEFFFFLDEKEEIIWTHGYRITSPGAAHAGAEASSHMNAFCFKILRKISGLWRWFTDTLVRKCQIQNLFLISQDMKAGIHDNVIVLLREFVWFLQLLFEVHSLKLNPKTLEKISAFVHPNLYRKILLWGHLGQK